MKEEKKKTTKKTTTKKSNTNKKTTEKKSVKKNVPKKEVLNLNETIKTEDVNKEVVINNVDNNNLVECRYCHQKFEKGYTICPYCHKRQSSGVGLAFFIVFGIVFLFGILTFHFVDKYIFNKVVETDFKDTCVLVDYENLVRHPKDYRNKNVKVIGKVVSVEGLDTGFANEMTITINANLFENEAEHLVTVYYSDKLYEQGFIEGDTITIYGTYESINGNVPSIDAKFIVFGK